jgi:hypothetical protein
MLLNDSGTVAGYFLKSTETDVTYHGFVRTPNGGITVFDPPDSIATIVKGMDAKGDIVGVYTTGLPVSQSFLRTPDGTIEDIPGEVRGMSKHGEIFGTVVLSGGYYGYVRDANGHTKILKHNFSPVAGEDGAIVGSRYEGTTSHGWLRTRQ